MRTACIAILAIGLSTTLHAEPAAPAAPAAAAAAEKPVCRYYQATGSIMPGKKYCLPKATWKEMDAQTRASTQNKLGGDRPGYGGTPSKVALGLPG